MGHSCCSKQKVKRGLWSPEEDEMLLNHITTHGHGSWSSVPKQAGLQRCGKSCRLRWINYLRPDLKRGSFTAQEEQIIIDVHRILGNRWAQIAKHLPGRTDNEVKNFWNSYIKKKLISQGLDPKTHNLIPSHKRANINVIASNSSSNLTCNSTISQHDQQVVPFTIVNTATDDTTLSTPCVSAMDVILYPNYNTMSSTNNNIISNSEYHNLTQNYNSNDNLHWNGNGSSTDVVLDDNYHDKNVTSWGGNDNGINYEYGINSIVDPYQVPTRPSILEQFTMQSQEEVIHQQIMNNIGVGHVSKLPSSCTSECFDLELMESTLLSASISNDHNMSSMDDDLAWIF